MDSAAFWAKWGNKAPQRKDGLCPRCKTSPRKVGDSYCLTCRREIQRKWMRANRPRYSDMTEEDRAKARCRGYTNVLVQRGQLKKEPCTTCGRTRFLEAHHADYTKPREVIWKCRRCHRDEHQKEKQMAKTAKQTVSQGIYTVDGAPGTPEVGATYLVKHRRKGNFQLRITKVDGEWAEGTIVDGTAGALNPVNVKEEGETVTIRATLCTMDRNAVLPENEWDGKPIPMERWGRDHASTLLYVEHVCTDKGGKPGMDQMRTEPGRMRKGWESERGLAPQLNPPSRYPTRLKNDFEMFGHDDWDCTNDFVEAGLLIAHGTSLQPIFQLTDLGWKIAAHLRKQRAGDVAPAEYEFTSL